MGRLEFHAGTHLLDVAGGYATPYNVTASSNEDNIGMIFVSFISIHIADLLNRAFGSEIIHTKGRDITRTLLEN